MTMHRTTKVKRQDVFRRNALDSRRTTINIQHPRFFPPNGVDAPPPPPPPRADPESIKSDLAEKIERIYRRVGEEQSLVEAGTTPRELIDNAYR
jgi:hypothetical protein